VKYQVALADGTIVAKTQEEGIEFYVKDGNVDQLEFVVLVWEYQLFLDDAYFCLIKLVLLFRSFMSSIAKSNHDHEKGRESQTSCSTSMYVFHHCYKLFHERLWHCSS
jgi:hypothetical protein